ncbi:hypothetical protein AKG95_14030 [Janthinobacterium lividum]|uniref:Uncharacterized protein n=1 Tax=Janthinobacterium lividum TaxID=29581 RepID=A0A1S1UA45_9BURK|nr:hypothetical protein AKG95_14030 [Janthinobacterium lividum]
MLSAGLLDFMLREWSDTLAPLECMARQALSFNLYNIFPFRTLAFEGMTGKVSENLFFSILIEQTMSFTVIFTSEPDTGLVLAVAIIVSVISHLISQ